MSYKHKTPVRVHSTRWQCSASVLQAEGNEVAAITLVAQFTLLWCFIEGLGTFILVKYFACFAMMLKTWIKKNSDSGLNGMKFFHPIFLFNLLDSKEVEILKGMLVFVSFGFSKTKNANNTVAKLFLKRFEDNWVYLFSDCSCRWKILAPFSSRLKSNVIAETVH